MADALASGQHGIHELLGLKLITIPFAAHLKPFHGIPCGVLQANHIDLAHCLVLLQHLGNLLPGIAQLLEFAHQFNRVLKRQFGARSNGEVRSVHGIAHQDHMAVAIEH